MRLVYVESPFKCRGGRGPDWESDGDLNIRYAKALCRHIALSGGAPFASHLFATQYLDDSVPSERELGISTCLAWGDKAGLTIVGVDRGLTRGMELGIERARSMGRPVQWMSLSDWSASWLPAGIDRDEWRRLMVFGDLVT